MIMTHPYRNALKPDETTELVPPSESASMNPSRFEIALHPPETPSHRFLCALYTVVTNNQ